MGLRKQQQTSETKNNNTITERQRIRIRSLVDADVAAGVAAADVAVDALV